MGSSSKKELPPYKKEYRIDSLVLGKLWGSENCINCVDGNTFVVISCRDQSNHLSCYNCCRKCLYNFLALRWQAIFMNDIPHELKKSLFRKFLMVVCK